MTRQLDLTRIYPETKEECRKIKIKTGLSYPKIIDRMVRNSDNQSKLFTNQFIKSISNWKKKGQENPLGSMYMIFILMGAVAGVIVLYWLFSLIAPVAFSMASTFNSDVGDIASSDSSIASAWSAPSAMATAVLSSMPIISYVSFFLVIVLFFVLAFNVQAHNWLILLWFGFVILLTGCGIFMSSVYTDFLSTDKDGFYTGWGVNNFIMSYYPVLIAVFGVSLGIILFAIGMKSNSESSFSGYGGIAQ